MPCTRRVALAALVAQALRAQTLYPHVGKPDPGADLRANGSGSAELPDLSELIKTRGSLELEGREAQLAEKLRGGAKMTPERWTQSGPELAQTLKTEFQKNGLVRRVVEKRCGTERQECTLKQLDSLMYPAVEMAAARGDLGDLAVLGNMVKSTLASSWFYGVDWNARCALITKWRDPEWLAEDTSSEAFNTMKAEIQQSPKVQELVGLICEGLDGARPGCRQFAPRAIFSQALANAAAGLKTSKAVVPRLEEALRSKGLAIQAAKAATVRHAKEPTVAQEPEVLAPVMAPSRVGEDDEFEEKLKAEVEAKARASGATQRPRSSGGSGMTEEEYFQKADKAKAAGAAQRPRTSRGSGMTEEDYFQKAEKARAAAAAHRSGSSGLFVMTQEQYLEKVAKAKKEAETEAKAKMAAQARAKRA